MKLPLLLLAASTPLFAQSKTLFGKLTDPAGHPAWGIGIMLASAPGVIQASTDSTGAWRIASPITGITRNTSTPVEERSHILVRNGRLSIAFDGVRADGRGFRSSTDLAAIARSNTSIASRSLSAPDTILFSARGEIRGRALVSDNADQGTLAIRLDGSITDPRDQKSYGTTRIGLQTWMTRNLELGTQGSWTYDQSADSIVKHGRLYTWAGAMALPDSCNRASCLDRIRNPHQGACPEGWHVPTQREWRNLSEYAGSNRLMVEGTFLGTRLVPIYAFDDTYRQIVTGYRTDSLVGNDAYGFHGFLSGYRRPDGGMAPRDTSLWWTTDHLDTDYEDYQSRFTIEPTAARAWMFHNAAGQVHMAVPKSAGSSLRCLAD